MNLYTNKELEIKSYEKLLDIAIKEKLIDIYSETKTKRQLIDLILKYRFNDYENKIRVKSEKGFFLIQNIIDEKLEKYINYENDIEIPRKIEIYKDINFSKIDNYLIYIEKNIKISENIVLLVGSNKYIYAILSLVKNSNDKRYNIYNFSDKIIERFTDQFSDDEKMSLLFFPNYEAQILTKLYFNESELIIPQKIRCYSVEIKEFLYKKLSISNDTLSIIFDNNKIKTKLFEKEFMMYIRKIDKDDIYIEYFDDAKKSIENKEYIVYGTYINSIDEILTNKKIQIFDDNLNCISIDTKILLDKFIQYLTEQVNSYYKKIHKNYYLVGLNLQSENFVYIPTFFVMNYLMFINKISKKYKSKKYLIISIEYNSLDICTNDIEIIEKDINYELKINTLVNYNSNDLSYKNIINHIYNFIKSRICGLNYLDITKKQCMKLIDENKYYKIKEKIKINNDECERQFSTEYTKYKNKINDEYLDIYKNHLILDKISKNIYDMYIKNNCENFYIEEFKINITKNQIEEVLSILIYKCLNEFFSKKSIINLINEYEGIKLIGSLTRTNAFYNSIKEFIPGKLIELDDNNDTFNFVNNIMEKYIYDKKMGIIKLENNIVYEKKKIKIAVLDFKNEYKLVDKFIDKIDDLKLLSIRIQIENSEYMYKDIIVKTNFIETDENFIDIEQIYLNSIENNIIRIFFRIDKDIEIIYIKRINDQTYYAKDIIYT